MDDLSEISIKLSTDFPDPGWIGAEITLKFWSDAEPKGGSIIDICIAVAGTPAESIHDIERKALAAAPQLLDCAAALLRENPVEELRRRAVQSRPFGVNPPE